MAVSVNVDEYASETFEGDARMLFANVVERCVCVFLDLVLAIMLASWISGEFGSGQASGIVMAVVLVGYFAGFWMSGMRATPAQFLFGFRVVSEEAEALSPGRAVLRSIGVLSLLFASAMIVLLPVKPYFGFVVLAAFGCVFLAGVTRKRQAAHDLLVRSIVVRAKALRKPGYCVALAALAADPDFQSAWLRRPSIRSIAETTFTLGLPALAMWFVADMQHYRDLRHRTGYAIAEAGQLKVPIEAFYEDRGRLPDDAAELGVSPRTDYPDGGYFKLEDRGRIRIRFSRLRDLTTGSILLSPRLSVDAIEWDCDTMGGFNRAYLPGICRN